MNYNRRASKPRASWLVAIGLALAASTVCADDAKDTANPKDKAGSSALESVTVTARRVEESAQTIPVAVTALSATALEERHITTAQDLQGQVPSLSVTPYSQTRDVELIAVRGQATTYGAPPAVVEYMAEVPLVAGTMTSLQGTPGQFLDLANIQVLRGPQGTLFGRNSTGGAVLLEPARPVNDLTGSIQLQGGNYQDKEVQAVVNVPVTDRLLVRLAGEFVDRDGYTRDVVNGTDYDNRHYWTGRFGMTWKPTDSIENYLMVSGTDSHSHDAGWILNGFNTPYINAVFGEYGGCAGVGLGTDCSVLTQLADAQNARSRRATSLGPTPPSLDDVVKGWSAIDQLKWQLSDSMALRNILSYSTLKAWGPFDGDGTALPWYNNNASLNGPTDNVRQLTEELQVQGDALEDNLTYTAGLYYEAIKTPSAVYLQNQVFLFSNNGLAYSFDNAATALYGQLGYDFANVASSLAGLKLTAGGRYTWDDVRGRTSGFVLHDGSPVACSNGVSGTPTAFMDCARAGTQKSSAPSWTVGLDYTFDDHVLGYAKISHGYKRGGLNLYSVNASHVTFQPEYVTTDEIGFKTTFRAGAVPFTFNADVFYTDYKDIQVAGPDFNAAAGASGAAVYNAAAATIKGVEVEGSVLPVTGLELTANYSHLEGAYKKFSLYSPFGQVDCSGGYVVGTVNLKCIPISYLPDNQFSITSRYTLPVSPDLGKVIFNATYAYTGSWINTTTTLPQGNPGSHFDAYGLWNLSLNWNGIARTPLDVGFFMTNAANKVYRTTYTGVWSTVGVEASLYGEPRMYGLQMRYHW